MGKLEGRRPLRRLWRRWDSNIKNCRENQNTHFIFNNVFWKIFPFETSKNVMDPEGLQMTS
jgi:hypothetical protein